MPGLSIKKRGRTTGPSLFGRVAATALGQAALLAGAALLIRSLHLRFVIDLPTFQAPVKDEWEGWDLAGKLAAGNWLGWGIGPYFRPQLFGYFLAVLRWATGGSLPVIHLVLVVMDAVTVGVMYLAARRLFPRKEALVGAAAVAVYWPLVYFSASLNKESFAIHLQAWLLLALLLWLRARTRREAWSWAAVAGALGGLALLTRPAVALPFAAALIWMYFAPGRQGRPFRRAGYLAPGAAAARLSAPLLCAAMAVLMLVPQAWRNLAVGGSPVLYARHGWLNLYFGNNDQGYSPENNNPGLLWEVFADLPRVEGGVAERDYASEDRYWRAAFFTYVTSRPDQFIGGLLRKAAEVVNAREVGITNSFAETASVSPVQRWMPGTGHLLPLALAGIVLWQRSEAARLRRAGGILILVFGALCLLGAAVVFADTRDRLAAFPALLLFAGPGLLRLIPAVRCRSLRPRAVAAGTLALSCLLVLWPLSRPGQARFDEWMRACNRGDALAQLWERDRRQETLRAATEAYEAALRIDPDGLQPLKQLPPLYLNSGRPADALDAQRRVIEELRRRFAGSIRIRARELEIGGKLAVQVGQPAEAVAFSREWRSLRVLEPEAMELEAVALAASGDRARALAVASERLRRVPADPQAARLLEMIRGMRR